MASVSRPVGVVARAMVAVGQDPAVGKRVQGAVTESRGTLAQAQGRQNGAVGDHAQGDDHPQARKTGYLFSQETPASGGLRPDGSVIWRHTTDGIGDPAADQPEAIVGPGPERAFGEAILEKRPIQEISGEIAGEGPAGTIGAA